MQAHYQCHFCAELQLHMLCQPQLCEGIHHQTKSENTLLNDKIEGICMYAVRHWNIAINLKNFSKPVYGHSHGKPHNIKHLNYSHTKHSCLAHTLYPSPCCNMVSHLWNKCTAYWSMRLHTFWMKVLIIQTIFYFLILIGWDEVCHKVWWKITIFG